MTKSIFLYNDTIGAVDYIDHMGSDLTIVNSARVSFGAHKNEMDERDINLVKYLIRNKHTSPFEHCNITFRFVVPLYVRSQHHRHRTWSFNEISRRYTSKDLQFYSPSKFRPQHKTNRQASTDEWKDFNMPSSTNVLVPPTTYPVATAVQEFHESALRLYNAMLKAGVCREQARGVLPQNLYTEYYGTVDLHNLIKFISLRLHEGAQWEIRQVAKACLNIATELFPITMSTFKEIQGEK